MDTNKTFALSIKEKRDGKFNSIIKNKILKVDVNSTWLDILQEQDQFTTETGVDVTVKLSVTSSGEDFTVDVHSIVGDAIEFENKLKYVNITLVRDSSEGPVITSPLRNISDVLFGGTSYVFPKKKYFNKMNEKDNLYNAIVDDMTKSNVKFPSYKADNEVEKYTRVLVNALWYLDGNKDKFKHQQVEKLPDRFLNQFNNYNDWKRKKIAALRIESVVLKEHVSCLMSLLDKPFSHSWGAFKTDVEMLALAMDSSARYLDEANANQTQRQLQTHPARELSKNVPILYIDASEDSFAPSSSYSKLLEVIPNENYVPIIFDEEKHLRIPFKNRMERARFFENIRLPFPLQMIRYDPGVDVLWRAPTEFDANEMMTQGARILKDVETHFPVFHTRQMKREFRENCKIMGAEIPPHEIWKIYSDLTGDASADQNPAIDERVRQAIIDDDPELVIDLRHLNKGRPGDMFQVVFDALESRSYDCS